MGTAYKVQEREERSRLGARFFCTANSEKSEAKSAVSLEYLLNIAKSGYVNVVVEGEMKQSNCYVLGTLLLKNDPMRNDLAFDTQGYEGISVVCWSDTSCTSPINSPKKFGDYVAGRPTGEILILPGQTRDFMREHFPRMIITGQVGFGCDKVNQLSVSEISSYICDAVLMHQDFAKIKKLDQSFRRIYCDS